jgi:hypothetical protein
MAKNPHYVNFESKILEADSDWFKELTAPRACTASTGGSSIKVTLKSGADVRLPLRNKWFAGAAIALGSDPAEAKMLLPAATGEAAKKRARILREFRESLEASGTGFVHVGIVRLSLKRLDATKRGQHVAAAIRIDNDVWIIADVKLSFREFADQVAKAGNSHVAFENRVEETVNLFRQQN